jgi:RNA recognition motif-containing protein
MENQKRLFVGGIAYKTSEEELQDAFAQAGTVVSVRIIKERETGRSKGFGFIEMETEAMAQAAIDMWNGKEMDGRELIVNIARAEEKRPSNGGFDRGGDRGGERREWRR